ncbi:MAG TPA: DUF2127 domain-containing protein [Candidatus Saccharimonadales bacterium]|nr:DUF2127 domain-containing protein [Candidatus Saccharimonadales bacterium]
MAWFHPKSLLDKTFEIGIILKGLNGAAELIGGLLLAVVPGHAIMHLTRWLTSSELNDEPHDFVATHILRYGTELAQGHNLFVILFLLTHGLVKVGLVIALLRQKLWAYPWALVALTVFLGYQIYLLIVHPTIAMGFLCVLDTVIIWLVWREWQKVKSPPAQAEA